MKPFFWGLCCVSRYFLIHCPLHAEVDHQPSSGLFIISLSDWSSSNFLHPSCLLHSVHCCQINLGKEASSVWFSFSQVFRNSLLPFKIEWFSTCFYSTSRLILLRFSQSAQLTYPQASSFFPPPCSWWALSLQDPPAICLLESYSCFKYSKVIFWAPRQVIPIALRDSLFRFLLLCIWW